MECNECGKETDSIMVICPECDGKKDEQIELLKAQLADRDERLALWREGKDYFSWSPFKRMEWQKALRDKGEI